MSPLLTRMLFFIYICRYLACFWRNIYFFMCWLSGELYLELSRGKIEEIVYPSSHLRVLHSLAQQPTHLPDLVASKWRGQSSCSELIGNFQSWVITCKALEQSHTALWAQADQCYLLQREKLAHMPGLFFLQLLMMKRREISWCNGSHCCPGVLWGLGDFWHGGRGMQLPWSELSLRCWSPALPWRTMVICVLFKSLSLILAAGTAKVISV